MFKRVLTRYQTRLYAFKHPFFILRVELKILNISKPNNEARITANEYQNIREEIKSPLPTSRPVDECETKKKKKKSLKFPWWCKIIGFILSFIFMAVSVTFVIFYGIQFGDLKCQKWLTSLLISFFTSIFLTQPLKVYFII